MAESNVITTRSLGTAVEGIRDQYADGKAAKLWEIFIGDKKSRTLNYKNFLVGLLRKKGCRRILDVACGTGYLGCLIIFHIATPIRPHVQFNTNKIVFEDFRSNFQSLLFSVIEEANWLTLYDDIEDYLGNGFDAVICLGNSFAHLLDNFGDQREQMQALRNFEKCVKPGGLLLIDHRNYDDIIDSGSTATKCIYYNSLHTTDIRTSVLFVGRKPALVTLDYFIDTSSTEEEKSDTISEFAKSEFRLSYYPHRLEVFKTMLRKAFGENSEYKIYGDFKSLEEVEVPNFYIHVVEKSDMEF
nr:glycine N-methyltransferase [Leptinotarsa decemlineata]